MNDLRFKLVGKEPTKHLKLHKSTAEMVELLKKKIKLYEDMQKACVQESLKEYEFYCRAGKVIENPVTRGVPRYGRGIEHMPCDKSPVGLCVYDYHDVYNARFDSSYARCVCCRKTNSDRRRELKKAKESKA